MSAEELLARLDRVRRSGEGRWTARCPGHEDKSPSLAVRELPDGRVLLHCFAGCGAGEVLGALGLEFDALFPPRTDHKARGHRACAPFSAQDALRCLAFEAALLMVYASDIAQGKALSVDDRERLALAASRVATVKEACCG